MSADHDISQPQVLTFKKKPGREVGYTLPARPPGKKNAKPAAKARRRAGQNSSPLPAAAAKPSAQPTRQPAAQPNTPAIFKGFARLNLRAKVIVVLQQVAEGQSLNQILPHAIEQIIPKDKALFNELIMGTLRHWFALDAQISPMLAKPLADSRVQVALLLGLYQLLQTRIPAHAAISETVEAIRQLKQPQASGLVNALLRRATREMSGIRPAFDGHHALPAWLYRQLGQDWGTHADRIAQALKQPAPLTLRINQRHITPQHYLQQLQQANIAAQACTLATQGIQILQAVAITQLPGFDQGWFSVQDEHAQLCGELLGNLDGKVVLDACAAPGGKTAHILEKNTPACLIALDRDARRLQRVNDNLQRLQLMGPHVQVVAADASHWVGQQPFDVILLDAPCTATGVIRRHPDIKLLRQDSDVAQTVQLQAALLDHLWEQLKAGGTLLYVTCSLLKQENAQQISHFLQRHANAQCLPMHQCLPALATHPAVDPATQTGMQFFPTTGQADGFYYAKLTKLA